MSKRAWLFMMESIEVNHTWVTDDVGGSTSGILTRADTEVKVNAEG